jgi:hypothetical protein
LFLTVACLLRDQTPFSASKKILQFFEKIPSMWRSMSSELRNM